MDTATTPTASDAASQTLPQLHQLIDDVKGLLDGVAEAGDRELEPMRNRLARQLRQLRLQVSELGQAGRYHMRRAARHTDETVHAHPYRAIGLAAAAGLVIGLIAARR